MMTSVLRAGAPMSQGAVGAVAHLPAIAVEEGRGPVLDGRSTTVS